jgi:hypothetical protein
MQIVKEKNLNKFEHRLKMATWLSIEFCQKLFFAINLKSRISAPMST